MHRLLISAVLVGVIVSSFVAFSTFASAQTLPAGPGFGSLPDGPNVTPAGGTAPFDISEMGMAELNARGMFRDAEHSPSPLQNPALTISSLDLKAPKAARGQFEKGFQLFSGRQYQSAIEHFLQAIIVYPDYIAAHNALGSAYLALKRDEDARTEFATAAVLDPHMPAPFLNLAYVELELKHYPSAEVAAQKAASIAPLDLSALSALAYSQLMNRDYGASIATVNKIHQSKQQDHAIVHLYAASAFENEGNLARSRAELQELIKEDPNSSAAATARELLQQLRTEPVPHSSSDTSTQSDNVIQSEFQEQIAIQTAQDSKEQEQVAEAEAMCESCESDVLPPSKATTLPRSDDKGWILHSNVNEVAVWFVATDHGRPIRDLTQSEVTVRDAGKPPSAVVAFRAEDQLPLRLGLVIDTSDSVASRFKFEQSAASEFLQRVLTNDQDSAFVIGVSNSVLLEQDFTSDKNKLSEAVESLAPAGGTALWDGVNFAADKLASLTETEPVAKILVVISDGRNNSGDASLKQVIEACEHKDITVYTVSTNDVRYVSTAFLDSMIVGERALKTLSERTGGMALNPGSIRNLNHSLDDLQEFIRSRYALSYKPALLKHDDQYRSINITAEKAGRKLHVYARKGYYARDSFAPVDPASSKIAN